MHFPPMTLLSLINDLTITNKQLYYHYLKT